MPTRTVLLRGAVAVLLLVASTVTLVRLLALDRSYPLVLVVTTLPWAVLAAALATVAAALLRWRVAVRAAAVVTVLGLALLGPRVVPGPYPDATPGGPRLTVAIADVHGGEVDVATLVEHVRTHDVEVLVALDLTPAAVEALDRAGLTTLLPHRSSLPAEDATSTAILAARPLTAAPAATDPRAPRADVTLGDGSTVAVQAVHAPPPVDEDATAAWQQALAAVPAPRTSGPPVLVVGGTNASHDHRLFRRLLDAGWEDAADVDGAALRATVTDLWSLPPVPPLTLDHVLVDRRVTVLEVDVLDLPGSDRGVLVTLLRLPDTRT